MSEQPSWETGKYVGGGIAAIISLITSVRILLKGRNTTHAERITNLEHSRREDRRVMAEVRTQLEEMTIQLSSTERRVRQIEVNQYDLDRMVRDNLQRMIEQIDRRLKHSVDHNTKSA